jgi:hypothetical protein
MRTWRLLVTLETATLVSAAGNGIAPDDEVASR